LSSDQSHRWDDGAILKAFESGVRSHLTAKEERAVLEQDYQQRVLQAWRQQQAEKPSHSQEDPRLQSRAQIPQPAPPSLSRHKVAGNYREQEKLASDATPNHAGELPRSPAVAERNEPTNISHAQAEAGRPGRDLKSSPRYANIDTFPPQRTRTVEANESRQNESSFASVPPSNAANHNVYSSPLRSGGDGRTPSSFYSHNDAEFRSPYNTYPPPIPQLSPGHNHGGGDPAARIAAVTGDAELQQLLLSWYYAGYHTGRHRAFQEVAQRARHPGQERVSASPFDEARSYSGGHHPSYAPHPHHHLYPQQGYAQSRHPPQWLPPPNHSPPPYARYHR